jgi:transposase
MLWADEGRRSFPAISFVQGLQGDIGKWIERPPELPRIGSSAPWSLSKNSWLQFPDRQKASVYPLKGGDSEGLMAKLVAACDRWTKVSGKKPSIILCYEAGYDAFWLARFLRARGIECRG